MINFKSVTFQNLLSNGKKPTTIDFVNGTTTLIVGTNGAGKSQIYEALFFGLYGKPFRKIKKDQLVNSINKKNLKVTIEFSNGKNDIKVVRGIKPNIFKIWVDGELRETEAAIKDQQSYFLSNLLQISENTFRQIVVLGSTSYVPFMLLPSHTRRAVIEDLLDLKIFSSMLSIARSSYNIRKRDLSDLERRVKENMVSIKAKQEQVEELKDLVENEKSDLVEQLKFIQEKLDTKSAERSKAIDQLSSINYDETVKSKELDKASTFKIVEVRAKMGSQLRNINKDLKLFSENDECPTCTQPIDPEFKHTKVHDCNDKKKKLAEYKVKVDSFSNDVESRLAEFDALLSKHVKLEKEVHKKESEVKSLTSNKESLEARIEAFKQGANAKALGSIESELSNLKESLTLNKAEGRELLTDVKNYDVLVELLKDTGIKAKIISTYLPVINQLIQKFMDILEFPLAFTFDNEFNEIIKSRGRDELSYGNFSAGEKLRIDLCLLFTWRELTKIKNSAHTNLIILDEIGDSSLDSAGLYGFNRILKSGGDSQCAIIISHNSENMKGIDKHITVEKKGNFSVYTTGDEK